MWHSAIMTEIEIGTETEIGIALEIAATTITASIATGTAMTGATWIGTGETTGDMIAGMMATTGAGMENAGFTGTAVTGFTNGFSYNEVSSF
jgi:hypothetical protein